MLQYCTIQNSTCLITCIHENQKHIHLYIQAYVHAYMRTCIRAYMHNMHTCIRAHIRRFIHTCISTRIHTCIHTYKHPSMHPSIPTSMHAHIIHAWMHTYTKLTHVHAIFLPIRLFIWQSFFLSNLSILLLSLSPGMYVPNYLSICLSTCLYVHKHMPLTMEAHGDFQLSLRILQAWLSNPSKASKPQLLAPNHETKAVACVCRQGVQEVCQLHVTVPGRLTEQVKAHP